MIEQLKNHVDFHVDEFNYLNETRIILKELKEYPRGKERTNIVWGLKVISYGYDKP